MISYLRGELAAVNETSAVIDVGGVGYEVIVPRPVADRLEARGVGTHVKLFTYHCERGGAAGAGVPLLVGFETELEREFFELLLGVPQLGPVGAARALALPIPTIAQAIALGDAKTLQSLPGVGKQRARDMIAKLQERMGPFVEAGEGLPERPHLDEAAAEALAVLIQLGLTEADALERIRTVREADPDLNEADEIVRAVFRRK